MAQVVAVMLRTWSSGLCRFLRIRPSLRANGKSALRVDKAKESRYGQMVRCMRAGGRTIKLMVKEDSFMQMEMCMMECGWMIRLMAMESTAIWMVQSMKETGRRTSNMVKE
jgi:hypothetical protein